MASAPSLLGALVLLSGCGGGGGAATAPVSTRTAPADAVGKATAAAAPPPASAGPAERRAGRDGTLRLEAARPPVTLRVRIEEIVDPAEATPDFSPQRDNRFVAVRLELANEGEQPYTDTPSSGAAVVDTNGRPHPAAVLHSTEPGLRRVTIGAGERVSGFLTFEVPRDARLGELRLRLNSGFGPETGVWALP